MSLNATNTKRSLESASHKNVQEGTVTHIYEGGSRMKTQFGTIATLGVSFSILNSWVAEAGSLLAPITLGGPVTILWGCLGAGIYTTILCLGIAELASALPNAGGPYHYTFVVAPKSCRNVLSFFVGWSNMISWWFIISSAALFLATFLQGMIVQTHSDYIPKAWQTWLIYVAINILCTALVIGANGIMAVVTSASLYWSLASFFICLITTVAMHRNEPYQPASFVFTNFTNSSGWKPDGVAFVLGWMLSCYNFLGIDAATHLSEEMPKPERDVPRAMLGALMTGMITSFSFLMALLFCVQDINEVVASPTGVPVLAILAQATRSTPAAIAMTCLIFVSIMFSELSGILVAGRTTWAFARDNGMPFSKYFSVIDERTQMPLRATLLSMFLSICYGAIYIGSPVAFTSIVGSSIVMLFSTYAVPQAILAIRGRHHLPPRPFNLHSLGRPFNALASILVLFCTVMLCFPTILPVGIADMNYLSVIVCGAWALVLVFYVLVKRGRYCGPIVN